jgi:hypothetical protein
MRQLVWIDADGNALTVRAMQEVRGLAGMPPMRASTLVVPMQPGSRWMRVDHAEREVAIPLAIYGSAAADAEALMDQMTVSFDPTRGDGRWRVIRHDGTERELFCRYVSSLEVTERKAFDAAWAGLAVFRAVDPYWYDRNSSSLIFSPGESPSFFPFFPLTLGASEVSTEATVNNDGHVTTWPVWTITGPGSVTATNTTTGETWDLDYTLDDGEVVTVDTRPGVKTVTSSTDGDLFANLTDESSLWALAKGTNTVTVTMAAASSASKLLLSWQRRWLTG